MTIFQWLTRLWKNYEETCESPSIPELKTLYHKLPKNMVMNAVTQALQKLPNWKVVHADHERGEITILARQGWGVHDITISVCSLSPRQTALDVVSAKRGWGGDLGQSYRNIMTFFHLVNKEITPENHNTA
ncbi:hypothetical protein [Ammoniphilus sp. 3BR4]|uniref:hypothetical protein n=1 Tax=Ammoniphilus sp. 3BR4 TaxID=3158265 RepID=UPI00346529D0